MEYIKRAPTRKMLWDKQLWRIQQSGRFTLCIVYISLLFDNMLLTVVVPIVPDMLYRIENNNLEPRIPDITLTDVIGNSLNCSKQEEDNSDCQHMANTTSYLEISRDYIIPQNIINENEEVGLLFASKAIVQLTVNPIVGPLTNRMGCPTPLFVGTLILIVSSLMFAYGETFTVMFLARSIQGIGSACISVAGMAMVADKYPDDKDRSKIMGITMGGIAAGVLMGYPFGSIMYDFVGKTCPLLILAGFLALDSVVQLIFLRPRLEPERLLVGTSIKKLLIDPYISLASGAICVSTFAIAILEPCLPIWLMESMSPPRWQLGMVFIPDSVGYLLGTNFFGSIAFKVGRWCTAMVSLIVVGICALTIPLSTHILQLVVPHFGLGLGIGIIDASLMPLLAYLVDSRYVALYGSVYAIAQVAVCIAYSIGPLLGGHLVKTIGFAWVMRIVGILNLLYCPLCYFLRNTPVHDENVAINLKGNDYRAAKSTPEEGRTAYSSFVNNDE